MNRTTQLIRRVARGSVVAALALSALLPGLAQADQARALLPFQARIAEASVAVPCGPTLQQLCVTIAGSGRATLTASDAYVVTGGTGRYSGASGSGTDSASIDRASGNAVSTFSGTLSSPGSLP